MTFKQKLDRVEYQSTEKGLAVQPILDMMASYSMKYRSNDVFKDTKPGEFQVFGREMAKVSSYA
jgi:DNA-binding HxlR family transcriptional regulator